ncbi:hypothetical protein [Mycoplasmopsis gallopavonis]|uniref:Uncharacterized protein n=1 Tax=Mycoplasmopsis gallopavonis TaxID=76629 RepID=A0A449AZA4_9BACT|nr:hypothetical protein [Mycoplasmopsis gallopavonis]RIV16352.1 hypothetical protein D1113_02670 [Mycoplasmopsis gallopavonis]VEU72879.1 Uncharacterised protein [Mycoplasmopsis gallopavonis]
MDWTWEIEEEKWPKNQEGEFIKPSSKEEKRLWKEKFGTKKYYKYISTIAIKNAKFYLNIYVINQIFIGILLGSAFFMGDFFNFKITIFIRLAFVITSVILFFI